MHIKIIRQCILLALFSLVSGVCVAAETRFCVVNNVGKDVVLSAKIETVNGMFGVPDPIGSLNHVANIPGYYSSANGYSYLNTSCIVMETMGGGHAVNVAPFVPSYPGETPPLPSLTSDKLTELKIVIAVVAPKGAYSDIVCSNTYPTDWRWPDNSVATVFLKEDGNLGCDLAINPVPQKRQPSIIEIMQQRNVKIINGT